MSPDKRYQTTNNDVCRLEKMLIEAVIGVGVRKTSGKVDDSPVQKIINSHQKTQEEDLWDTENKEKLTIRV